MKSSTKSALELVGLVLTFLIISYFVQEDIEFFKGLIGEGFSGMVIYVLLVLLAIVVAPISSIPFIPLASKLWGWKVVALLNIFSWTLGSWIVFIIARKWGVPIVRKLFSIEKINKIESKIPSENVFWSVVFLRMIVPVDVLSYALGLFSKMKVSHYFLASFLGVIPIATAFAYFGELPWIYQIVVGLTISVLVFVVLIIREIRTSN